MTFILFCCMGSSAVLFAKGVDHIADVTVEVISDERGVLTKHAADSSIRQENRSYVVARNNERYMIRVHNRSNERVGLVIAVDGRNIISGRQSSLSSHERMYILEPYQTGQYEGWRTGQNRVNRFYFTSMGDSYAAAWGDHSAMGVIAVAAYKSQRRDVFRPGPGQKKTRPLDQHGAREFKKEPGTGFGETEWAPSRTVQFMPMATAFTRQFIKYEYVATLCKRGVINCRENRGPRERNRFWPDDHRNYGFAPFPPLWPIR
jgi:hypothetical protein